MVMEKPWATPKTARMHAMEKVFILIILDRIKIVKSLI